MICIDSRHHQQPAPSGKSHSPCQLSSALAQIPLPRKYTTPLRFANLLRLLLKLHFAKSTFTVEHRYRARLQCIPKPVPVTSITPLSYIASCVPSAADDDGDTGKIEIFFVSLQNGRVARMEGQRGLADNSPASPFANCRRL